VIEPNRCKPISGGIASIDMAQAGVWGTVRGLEGTVYGVLLAHADAFTGRIAGLSVGTIAREVLAGERPVQKALSGLAAKGIIRIVFGGGRHVMNEYQIEIDPAAIEKAVADARAAFQGRCKSRLAAAETRRIHRQHVDGVSVGGEVPKHRQHVDTVSEADTPSPGDENPVTETQKPRHAATETPSPGDENPVSMLTPQHSEHQQQNTLTPGEHSEGDGACVDRVSAAAAGAEGESTDSTATSAPAEAAAELARVTAEIHAVNLKGGSNGDFDRLMGLVRQRATLIQQHPELEPPAADPAPPAADRQPATPAVLERAESGNGQFAIAHVLMGAGCDEAFAEAVNARFALHPEDGLAIAQRGVAEMRASRTPVRTSGAWLRRFLERQGVRI
jgi:hypothetical protein